ncbi:hypothetical protein GWO43_25970 [candidate division KSB1 bacterium]|nr:hypothetical protein [candidate division KSB1 bacterium]NIR69259.1 hypothetical protein [candidate division KSB1 bacterium]NIS27432.1 hypothetical protein [candidate division KSB1 bacterium]NIT74258.1 hypothetical protein [candidate division KSB1 bacterium]NIU28150.1 hypothetical protein [candidate division KSB1 bacterium]
MPSSIIKIKYIQPYSGFTEFLRIDQRHGSLAISFAFITDDHAPEFKALSIAIRDKNRKSEQLTGFFAIAL